MRRIIWFNDKNSYEEFSLNTTKICSNLKFEVIDNIVYCIKNNQRVILNQHQTYQFLENHFVILSDNITKYKVKNNLVLIGPNNADLIVKQGKFIIENSVFTNVTQEDVYINGELVLTKSIKLTRGERILLPNNIEILWQESTLSICANEQMFESKLEVEITTSELVNYPLYKRSPRLIKKISEEEIKISKINSKQLDTKNQIARVIVPPLTMASGTIAMSVMMGRGIYVLFGLGATLITTSFSLSSYLSEKKLAKQKDFKRLKTYENYLLDMRQKLNHLKTNEIKAYEYNYPNQNQVLSLINNYSSRIYERDFNDDDFLCVNVGSSTQKANYKIKLDYDQMHHDSHPLILEAKSLVDEFSNIENKPNLIDLKNAHLGIVGEKHEVHQQLKNIISQLSFFHSYHDLQMICLYDQSYKDEFDYLKWYPHFRLHKTNLSGNVFNEVIKEQVISSLYQIIKERKAKIDENQVQTKFKPHYVIIVDDYNLIMNHAIMQYLQTPGTDLGFSLIFTAQKRFNLPENIFSVLVINDTTNATLLMNEKNEVNEKINIKNNKNLNFEQSARYLSSLIHQNVLTSKIPKKVTFLDLYKIKDINQLNIEQRWNKSQAHKSLAVPIGMRSKEDIVYLNLHEKAHGPHGLVAGTTGSGKSELIQTYILSLALNFSPHEVGFLLIDYKGGGMANLFSEMPHLLGTITNLDGSLSMRALASIKAELSRRQKIFNEHKVNNINSYNKLVKAKRASEPLPHLFIISDEFAELKKEQPEFMSELVTIARIGRTIGVHLILATQKPTGVVDEQIWSNSNFKIALKVQDQKDSKEILKTPDAAAITQQGRAYLQVGNNEIYELFQSAWSGATWNENDFKQYVDKRIYKVNELGQGQIINDDLSEDIEQNIDSVTQLKAVVEQIKKQHIRLNMSNVKKTWLPALNSKLVTPMITKATNCDNITQLDLQIAIGLVDIPEKQLQTNYVTNFAKDGNLAIFASSGFGKTTTLATIIMSLALKNNPQLMNFYILDFGNYSLVPFKNLPHVNDYITFENEEKIIKFVKLINKEMIKRKRLLSEKMAQNFDVYNQKNEENKMSAMFIVIDNFDVVKEMGLEFEDFFTKLTRDGSTIGIYTIITATRSNAIKYSVLHNFNNKIVQYTFDENDANNLLGRSNYKLNQTKGRALIKKDIISLMQVYLMFDVKNDLEYSNKMKQLVEEIANKYSGEKLKPIPILPEIFTQDMFENYELEQTNKNLIGLSIDKVKCVSAPITSSPFVIIGSSGSGKTNVLKVLLNQIKEKVYLFDFNASSLSIYANLNNVTYVKTSQEQQNFVEELTTIVNTRMQIIQEYVNNNSYEKISEYKNNLENIYIIIDDVDQFIKIYEYDLNLAKLIEQGRDINIHLIASIHTNRFKGFDDITKYIKQANSGIVLSAPNNLPLLILDLNDQINNSNVFMFDNGVKRKIRIPKAK